MNPPRHARRGTLTGRKALNTESVNPPACDSHERNGTGGGWSVDSHDGFVNLIFTRADGLATFHAILGPNTAADLALRLATHSPSPHAWRATVTADWLLSLSPLETGDRRQETKGAEATEAKEITSCCRRR